MNILEVGLIVLTGTLPFLLLTTMVILAMVELKYSRCDHIKNMYCSIFTSRRTKKSHKIAIATMAIT